MIKIRHAKERGKTNFDWLESYHSFSFGRYRDPEHMGFGPLRVINEDWVAEGKGFDTHPHSNMEIVSYVVEGALAHKDSLGTGSVIKPGDIQRMSAGSGIQHSEYNPSDDDAVHLLQIWFLPAKQNTQPSYAQKSFENKDKQGCLKLVMSGDGRDGSLLVYQDVDMYVGLLDKNDVKVAFIPKPGRLQWVQLVRGQLDVNGQTLNAGDGAAISDENHIKFDNAKAAEVILFDMVSVP